MNISFILSKSSKKVSILDLINFSNLSDDNDILMYDDKDYVNCHNEDYDYSISNEKINFNNDLYEYDTIIYL